MQKKAKGAIVTISIIAVVLVSAGIIWGLTSQTGNKQVTETTPETTTTTSTQEPTTTASVTETTIPETTPVETSAETSEETTASVTETTTTPTTVKPTATTKAPTPKPATPTPTIAETTVTEAWMEAKGTSSLYDGAMQERADNGYESIPRSATLDALAQGRAEELALLGEINHNNMPNEANWEGLISGTPAGAYLYWHCADGFAATTIGIGSATYHRADGSTYRVTCMLLKE